MPWQIAHRLLFLRKAGCDALGHLWPMLSYPSTLWSVGLGGIVDRALLRLFLGIPLSSKMISLKEILNCLISRKDFENWVEFECLMTIPFKNNNNTHTHKTKQSWKLNVWGWILAASKETLEEIIRPCYDSLMYLFSTSSCGKGCMLFFKKIDIFILGWKLYPKTHLICLLLLIFTAWWNKQRNSQQWSKNPSRSCLETARNLILKNQIEHY